LKRATFDAGGALNVVRDVARAVAYAHEQGVVHCDLKPANVLLDRAGRVVVSDFGFAQMLTAERKTSHVGYAVGGTAGYLAPELL
jgi:serine/threonine-protein kinase